MKRLLRLIEIYFWIPVRKWDPDIDRVVTVTFINEQGRQVCDAYIHRVTKKWCLRSGSGVIVPGTVLAWRATRRPYQGGTNGY